MNKFFYYYNSLCQGANSPTAFSFDPYIIAVKEMLFTELQQVVYYIEKLKDFDIDMTEYTDKVIDFISILIVNLDFKRDSFFVIVEDLYNNKKKLEDMYIALCKDIKGEPQLLANEKWDLNSKESIIKILNENENKLLWRNLNDDNRILYELMINIVLNACNSLIELKNFGVDFKEAKEEVLKLLNLSNSTIDDIEDLKNKLIEFAQCNYKIVKLLNSTINEKFGPVIKSEVPLSRFEGKAILVSGNSLLDLEKILITALKDNINVYTHQEMISAFQYKYLKDYPNLKGHYQTSGQNFSMDFAEFPGPIYISRNSLPKVDMIRGQIYTSAKYPEYGISKIDNNEFTPLIEYAIKSQGFNSDSKYKSVDIGYSFNEVDEIIDDISNKFKRGKIKHIFIIGIIDMFNYSSDYISKFIKECPNDSYIISFGHDSTRDNFWQANAFYDFSLLYNLIEKLSTKIYDFKDNISIILSECTPNTISHLFNLMYLKVKNIFVGSCCPNIINPIVIDGLSKLFDVKQIDSPKKDISIALNNNKEEE